MIDLYNHAHLAPGSSIMLSVEALTLKHLTAAVSYVVLPGHTPMTIYTLSMTLNYPHSVLGTNAKLHQYCPQYDVKLFNFILDMILNYLALCVNTWFLAAYLC